MGWLDYHLQLFRIRLPRKRKLLEIGIPTDDYYDEPLLPGWEIHITEYFTEPGKSALYRYDFGDGWDHHVLLEGILLKEEGIRYPKCVAGERACPPEDCGGVPGYYELIEILKSPKHPQYRDYIEWLKGHAKNYYPYEQDQFNSEKVEFWDPKRRLNMAFS
jgi:Plasmid pRiA4b ORF-3-like protein